MRPRSPDDCIVHLETTEATKLRTLFETFAPLVVEANLVFKPTGVWSYSLSRKVLTCLKLTNFASGRYSCKSQTTVGVSYQVLFKAFAQVTQTDTVIIQITKEGLDASTFALWFLNENGYCVNYTIPMLDLDMPDHTMPERQFDTVIKMSSLEFQRIIRRCAAMGPIIQILAKSTQPTPNSRRYIHFVALGELTMGCKCCVSVPFDDEGVVPIGSQPCPGGPCVDGSVRPDNLEEPSERRDCDKRDLYLIRHLLEVTKASAMSPWISIYLVTEYPLILNYSVGSLGTVLFCVGALEQEEDQPAETLKKLDERVEAVAATTVPEPKPAFVANEVDSVDANDIDSVDDDTAPVLYDHEMVADADAFENQAADEDNVDEDVEFD